MAVFEVCIQVQAGSFYHMRNIKIFLGIGGGGGWRNLYVSEGKIPQVAIKVIKR